MSTTANTATASPDDLLQQAATDLSARQAAIDTQTRKDIAADYYKNVLGSSLGLLGSAAGIYIAVKRKSGFWGGVGWFFLIGMAGSAVGYVAGGIIDGKPKT